jgi:hypothetical protein
MTHRPRPLVAGNWKMNGLRESLGNCGLRSGDDRGVDGHVLRAAVYSMASGIGFIG